MPTQPAGMMGQMTPEQAPVQPTAEQAPQKPQSGGYNGTIMLDGEAFQVKGGIIDDDDGETFYVSDNGEMIVDGERNIVGYVKDGQAYPLDDEHIEVLREMGVLE